VITLHSCNSDNMATYFWEGMSTGEDLSKDDPRLAFRNRLIINKQSTANLPIVTIGALAIKAWNLFAEGKSIKVLQWRGGKAAGMEKFPDIIGCSPEQFRQVINL